MSTATDIWNSHAPTSQSSFWDTYIRGRPQIPDSTWQRILDYHRRYGNGHSKKAHDLGSGPGIHAVALKKHFDHVTITDPGQTNIVAAREALGGAAHQHTFHIDHAENRQAVEEYDLVLMANSLHFADPDVALQKVAASLQPGGTFVAMLFGFPDGIRSCAWEAYLEWLRAGVDTLAKTSKTEALAYTIVAQETGYDCIELDPTQWRDVKRVRINQPTQRQIANQHITDLYKQPWNGVSADEEVMSIEDRAWSKTTDVEGLKEAIDTFPLPTTEKEKQQMLEVLDEAYADGEPVEILYGVHLVLATKR